MPSEAKTLMRLTARDARGNGSPEKQASYIGKP